MKITKVVVYDIDFGHDFLGRRQNPIVVRLITDEGIEGIGEIGLAYGNAAKAAIGQVEEIARAFLIGADPTRIEHFWNTVLRQTFWAQGGGPVIYGALSAIDVALWDIKGKWLEVPVYELLGGLVYERVRLYANGWSDNLVLPNEYAEKACQVIDDGYTALKFDPFAVTPQGKWEFPRRSIDRNLMQLAYERVKAVRKAVGDEVDIAIEVHGNLGVTEAIRMGRMFEEFDPYFYEEPVDSLNIDVLKKVTENVRIPIAAGERLYTRYGFRTVIEKQALNIIQPDIGLAGGLTEVRKIASYADVYSIYVQPHTCGGPIATAAAIQFDVCTTNFIIQEWFPYWPDARYNIIKEPLEPMAKRGYFAIDNMPEERGLGVRLNEDFVKRYPHITIG